MKMQRWSQRIGLGSLAVLAAFLVLGLAASPAAAQTRDDGVDEANDFISACVGMGGDPEVIEADDDWIIVECNLPNGDLFKCDWSDGGDWSQHCHLFGPPPGGDLPELGPIEVPPDFEPNPGDSPPVAAPADPNAAPLARPDRYRVTEDRVLRRGPAQGVLANDADPDGDRLAVRLVAGPSKGRLGLKPDGSFTYRPKRNVHGTDRFTYEVRDGEGGTATATVTIKVTARPR